MPSHQLDSALAAWRAALGDGAVLTGAQCQPYQKNCIGTHRTIPAVVRASSEAEVVEAVRIAAVHSVPLYPVSTGRNWGYGSANPAADHCVVLDLSAMNRIVHVDRDLAVVTLQPGVTQGQLAEHLDREGVDLMVPVTGAGPTTSVLGNALERGFGLTPYADHFSAVNAVRAVLPDGGIYRSAIAEAGGEAVDGLYKWGVGPYLDGLFSQGGFGIVTEMTIALARRPPVVETFMFDLRADTSLETAVELVRDLMAAFPGLISSINLMNRLRMLSMTAPYPAAQVPEGEAIPGAVLDAMGTAHDIAEWTGVGALYAEPALAPGLRKALRRRLRPHSRRVIFFSVAKTRTLQRLARLVPGRKAAVMRTRLQKLGEALDILSGRPRETALQLAYWRPGRRPPDGEALDPARDGRGLIWFAPLVPMRGDAAASYVAMASRVCIRHGIDPLITLTALSGRCFDSTVPILFDPETGTARAQACYDELFREGQRLGFLPYRMSVDSMPLYTGVDGSTFWPLVRSIKQAVDPQGLIAPGRYSPP